MDNGDNNENTGRGKQNNVNILVSATMLIFLLLRFFIPIEGFKGLLITACFYIALLFYVIMSFLYVIGKVKAMKAGDASARVDKSFVWFMIVAIVGIFLVPYGLFNCGTDLLHGPEQLSVYNISVERYRGRRTPTTYKLVTIDRSYSISGDTYYELENYEGIDMDIVVYPRTKILVSYEIAE